MRTAKDFVASMNAGTLLNDLSTSPALRHPHTTVALHARAHLLTSAQQVEPFHPTVYAYMQ